MFWGEKSVGKNVISDAIHRNEGGLLPKMISDKLGGGALQKKVTLKGLGSFDVFLRLSLMARFKNTVVKVDFCALSRRLER